MLADSDSLFFIREHPTLTFDGTPNTADLDRIFSKKVKSDMDLAERDHEIWTNEARVGKQDEGPRALEEVY